MIFSTRSLLRFLFLVLGIIERDVTSLTGTDAYGIFDGDHKDASVTNLAGVGGFHDSLDGLLYVDLPYDDGDKDAFDRTCVVSHSTINAGLTGLPDASHFIIREPFNVSLEQGLLDIIESGPSDNCLNFFS